MVANSRASAFLILTLAAPLAACGGADNGVFTAGSGNAGGGGGGGGGGSDNPTYYAFDNLAGDQEFGATVARTHTKAFSDQPVGTAGGTVSYSAATNSYTVDYFGLPVETYTLGYDADAGKTFTIDAFGNGGPDLTYTRVATWFKDDSAYGDVTRAIIGVPTVSGDVPAGTATYVQSGFQGDAVREENGLAVGYDLGNSTLDLSVDFAARTYDMRMTLVGTPVAGGADTTLGVYTPFSPTELYSRGTSFNGSLTREGLGSFIGFFSGRFFGPQAIEYGMTFGIDDDEGAQRLIAAGAVAGLRQ